MAEIDRTLIGSITQPFHVDVERGAIRKFADAIGDPSLLYRDADYARAMGYDGIIAPPTFPTCFRPAVEPPWFEHLDRRRVVAGQVSFDYQRPIVAGMRLACTLKFVGVDDKAGSKGRMELLHQAMEGRDDTGELVFVAGRTTVYRSLEQVERRSLA
ncbi:MAG: MaoC family dehydratase N-terminal domain-containing protein [Betaproteobacteria bacterium]